MTLPRPSPPDGPAGPVQASASPGPPPVLVEDRREHRIRKPADLLRCLACVVGVVVLAGLGIVASATADGVETNIVEVSKAVPHAVLVTVRPIALFALLALSLALAIRQVTRRQPRALAEAVATGVLAGAAVTATNYLLRHRIAWRLYDAITMSKPDVSHTAALDGYLAALVAYAAMLGLGGRQARWRNAMWILIGIYALVNLSASTTTILSLAISVLAGGAIGLGVRYAAGVIPTRPTAEDIAAALNSAGCPVSEMRRVWLQGTEAESRRYAAVALAGGRLNVTVYDWDQQAAGLLYRLYRLVRLQRQVSRGAPLSQDRAVERLALLSYAAHDAGVPMPRLRALVQAGQQAAVLAYEHHDGATLADYAPEPTDAQLGRVWDDVLRLHARRVTHRALTADHMLLTDDGGVLLLPTPTGDVAASDLQIRLDRAQLMAELALLVGPGRSADLALAKIPTDEIITTVPLLQAVALSRSTRHELRRRRDVLPALRKRLLTHVPGGEVAPVQLERIRLRTLVTLIASVVAAYLLAGELARDSLPSVVRSADWRWGIVALGLSALTYAGAALSLIGFVTEKLSFGLTVLAQLASSFVTLVTPAAVGGAAVNIRYLQRRKIPAAVAAASVGVSQVVAFVMHISLLVIFIALTGTNESNPIKLPVVAYFIIAGLIAIAATVAAIPAGRRLLRARVAPTINQVLPQLLQIAQHPRKLAEGIGGTLLLSAAYIGCLAVCVRALGGTVPIASVAVVYLTGSAIGSLVPTPGGLGAIEAALSAGLTAAGMPGAAAVSAVLLYRLLTFWLPVPIGWLALKYLERRQAI
ncbi:MAG TPA: lysylphosphatidylglycerol synthase transmembrane domain-containing protein [Trebonia sp.]|nr:lysylphosphatidylglycerol synthase transmembrane domain-containing protein [Trebonia sp.]